MKVFATTFGDEMKLFFSHLLIYSFKVEKGFIIIENKNELAAVATGSA